jgi:hypothetical protein
MTLEKYYWPEDSNPPLFEFVNPVVFYNLVSANKDKIVGHPYDTHGRASDKPRRIGEIWATRVAISQSVHGLISVHEAVHASVAIAISEQAS